MTLLGIQDMAQALARSGLRAKEICRAIDCHPLTARAAIRAVRARGDHLVSGGDRAGLEAEVKQNEVTIRRLRKAPQKGK